MGKCILHFDRIQIVGQESSSACADNYWMIVHWFVGTSGRQLHVLPLANASDTAELESNYNARPISLEVDCGDDALVTAAYQIVDLEACDMHSHGRVAGDFAQRSAQALTQAYVEAAEFLVENQDSLPGRVFDSGSEDVRSAIRDSLIEAFEWNIMSCFDEASGAARDHGRGNSSGDGDVLHDIAIFSPMKPIPPLHTHCQIYVADAKAGCGRVSTAVHLTLERRLRTVAWLPPEFPDDEAQRADDAPPAADQASC